MLRRKDRRLRRVPSVLRGSPEKTAGTPGWGEVTKDEIFDKEPTYILSHIGDPLGTLGWPVARQDELMLVP
jgi:hypothetical protein